MKQTTEAKETINYLIRQRVSAHPRKAAIMDGEIEISYEDLNKRAGAIARELNERGVEPGSLVGVCMARSWELVATLLGVLKAGCAYVPLDPGYPRERVRYMLNHSQAVAAIVDHSSTAELCEGVRELVMLAEVNEDGEANLQSTSPSPSDLAYTIYTSGSTGKPKGVAVEHRSVVALSQAMNELLDEDELSGVLASASVCFDQSVFEILGTLSLGGTVILVENILALPDLPSSIRVRTCITVPSAMQALLSSGQLSRGIRCFLFGGEVLKKSLVEQIHALDPQPRVINIYGPTEDTVYSTAFEVSPHCESITIGKPVPNSRSYILDEDLQVLAPGQEGELYLAGAKLARDYLNDEKFTQERFLELEPNETIPETRLYKTGDLCRWLDNGEIEFLGRIDHQVKVRGFRIELEEIEATLEMMPGMERSAANVVDGAGGQKILVVYAVTQDSTICAESVRAFLADRLPKQSVPHAVAFIDELPLMPNGKLDRKQLPRLDQAMADQHHDNVIKADLEDGVSRAEKQKAILSVIKKEVESLLTFPQEAGEFSPKSTFDQLGIDSLTSLELSNRLSKTLGQRLSASAISEYPTPTALSDYIVEQLAGAIEGVASKKNLSQAPETLSGFQSQLQSSYPTFQAAKANAWSATDKGVLVQELQRLIVRSGQGSYSKQLRNGSGARGLVLDARTNEEKQAIIWSTNLYLGLNRNLQVINDARNAVERFGTGMGTSPAASGVTDLHAQFEVEFAKLVGKPDACLFPTGYTANVGAIAGILGKNDVIVMDQLCHASIVDGARLCGAKIRTFKHNDTEDLASVLESETTPYNTVMVVFEGVYSMGEGAAPVAELVRTAKNFDALVLVDEAHSFGFYGPQGGGICAAEGVTDQVDFIMTTLSKAMGSLGGVIAARKEHIDLLKSSSRAYIFQASVSPADIAAALSALRLLSTDDSIRQRLWDTTAYMRKSFEDAGYDLGTGDGPIVTPHFSDKDKLFNIVQGMYRRGVQTSAVTYPIVESGRGRLRFICSASHTKDDVDKTLKALMEAEREAELKQAKPSNSSSNPVSGGESDLNQWADGFYAFLEKWANKNQNRTPNVAIAFSSTDQDQVTIVLKDGEVDKGSIKIPDTPYCRLAFGDDHGVGSLCSSDISGVLDVICKGTCDLRGQVEPFIWLVGRLMEYRRGLGASLSDDTVLGEGISAKP